MFARTYIALVSLILAALPAPGSATSLADGVAIATPSVVQVIVEKNQKLPAETMRKLHPDSVPRYRTLGSGVIATPDGYIYTVSHLLEDAGGIRVRTSDMQQFDAKIVGRDRRTNLALLKVDAKGLPAAKIGDYAQTRLGEPIFSIGLLSEDVGGGAIVTDGILSTLKYESDADYLPMIQTTSETVDSMGGGGLFNARGELLGLNAHTYLNKLQGRNLSFAIPLSEAAPVLDELRQFGKVRRSSIGIGMVPVLERLAISLALPGLKGALVQSVAPDGPADVVGILPGDVVVELAGRSVRGAMDIIRALQHVKPGTSVSVKLWSERQFKELVLTTSESQER